jgi:pentatricopeptide repeat protein
MNLYLTLSSCGKTKDLQKSSSIFNQMWSFRLVPEIARIYSKPDYPRHQPNTVVPSYSAAMHAKYEVLQAAIEENPFKTRYFSWSDIGLFREFIARRQKVQRFSLFLPSGFRSHSVAYQELRPRDTNASLTEIVYNNLIWVCGGFFIAESRVMHRWTVEYEV